MNDLNDLPLVWILQKILQKIWILFWHFDVNSNTASIFYEFFHLSSKDLLGIILSIGFWIYRELFYFLEINMRHFSKIKNNDEIKKRKRKGVTIDGNNLKYYISI